MRVGGISLGLVVLLISGGGAAAMTASQQRLPISIAFWTKSHGIASFELPRPKNEGQLAVTTDGGRTWQVRWHGRAVGNVSTVPGTNNAWAEISAKTCVDCPTDLLTSSDGGETWKMGTRKLSVPTFGTRRVGYAFRSRQADGGPLLKTVDAGRTWKAAPSPCESFQRPAWSAAVSFVSATHGWVVCTGQPGAGNQSKAIYVTRDGGRRWTRLVDVSMGLVRHRSGGIESFGYPRGMSFERSGRGFLWEDRGRSYLTRNGGRDWHPIPVTSPEVRIGESGWMISVRVAYLLVQDSGRRFDYELLGTVDGGARWRIVHSWSRR